MLSSFLCFSLLLDYLLQQAGLDLNATDGAGSTPLHIAAKCNHLAVVLKLLDLGANNTATDGDNKTALELAPKYNKQMLKALQ